jgi:ribosome-associated protein
VRGQLEEHLAEDIVVIGLEGKSTIGDHMVIATGRSKRQVIALAEHLTRALKSHGIGGTRPEGIPQGDWVLIDAGDVIVHLFRPEVREFYGLEKMWRTDFAAPDQLAETAETNV